VSPLEKISAQRLPFAELLGIEFLTAEADRVVAKMSVRADLCTVGGIAHGGAIMSLADTVGAVATIINLPEGARGTATIESKTISSDRRPRARRWSRPQLPFIAVAAPRSGAPRLNRKMAGSLPS
jgi:hypothetical protein